MTFKDDVNSVYEDAKREVKDAVADTEAAAKKTKNAVEAEVNKI